MVILTVMAVQRSVISSTVSLRVRQVGSSKMARTKQRLMRASGPCLSMADAHAGEELVGELLHISEMLEPPLSNDELQRNNTKRLRRDDNLLTSQKAGA